MKVPKKNIEAVLVDVKRPGFNYAHVSHRFVDLRRALARRARASLPPLVARAAGIAVIILILTGGGILAARFSTLRGELKDKKERVAKNLISSVDAIKSFDAARAQESLGESLGALHEIRDSFGTEGALFRGLASIVPVVRDAGALVTDLTFFNVDMVHLAELMGTLKSSGMKEFMHDGGAFLARFAELGKLVASIRVRGDTLRDTTARLGNIRQFEELEALMRDYYLSYSGELNNLQEFLDQLAAIFAMEEPQNMLVMFHNDSELRPAGGFLGSYGVLSVARGAMQELMVGDIYWPDHEMNFEEKLIPPYPLQRVTTDWGARDANWFFDFPTSAEAVMSLLERSKIYREPKTTFIGAIAVNTRVLQTLIEAAGPIELPDYDLTITPDNFLAELQREVETGKDKKVGENPKRILSALAPLLLARLESLSAEAMQGLMERLGEHMKNKDIMVTARNEKLQNVLHEYAIDGSVYALPDGFWGSYLAVVGANVAGGKSDAVVTQEIETWIDVGTNGGSVSDVSVRRTHEGAEEKAEWYRADNKSYVQIFLNPETDMLFMKGNDARDAVHREYGDYEWYEPLREVEETRSYLRDYAAWETKEAGKSVFGTWLITKAGTTEELSARFSTPAVSNFILTTGKQFRFVFDRQSGAHTSLKAVIGAPVGYIWKESGTPVYTFTAKNPAKREIVALTLAKDETK